MNHSDPSKSISSSAFTLSLISLCLLLFSCGDAGNKPWQAHAISVTAGSDNEILCMQLIDLNGDGRDEILVGRQDSEFIYCYSAAPSADGVLLWSEIRIPVARSIQQLHVWNQGTLKNPERYLVLASTAATADVLMSPIPAGDTVFDPKNWSFDVIPAPSGEWTAITSGDFNNDGISDLALAGRAGDETSLSAPELVWMSMPQSNERMFVRIGKSALPLLLAEEDVEGDGDMDLLVVDAAAGANSMGAYWLENPWPENPEVEWKRNFITLSALTPTGGTVVDFGQDQHQDLLLCLQERNGANRLICFRKITARSEIAWLPLPFPLTGKQGRLSQATMADIDRDGRNDLVLGFTLSPEKAEHLIWLRNPTGETDAPVWEPRALSGPQGDSTAAVALSDIDGDGDIDVVSADQKGKLRWYENGVPAATPVIAP